MQMYVIINGVRYTIQDMPTVEETVTEDIIF